MEKDENKELENDTHTTDPQQHEIDGNVFGALFDKLIKPLDGPDFLEKESGNDTQENTTDKTE